MSQNNFIVQDVVAHIHDEEAYQLKRSTGHIFHKIVKNFWMYGFIMALSLGVGYSAVYIADSSGKSAQQDDVSSMLSGLGKAAGAGGLGSLSDDQKKALLKQLQAGGGIP
ncbi:MAG: hypothetical protein PHC61_04370 [Chitinivibrionales bacterium]|nr:hypothetical protein [Chitinivibrionales bacterium]